MMYSQGRHPSGSESISSQISDATSRATTSSDSRSDFKNDTELQYQSGINQFNTSSIDDDQSVLASLDSESIITVISAKSEKLINNNNHLNGINSQEQWSNPYWNQDSNPTTGLTQSGIHQTNNNANGQGPPSLVGVEQLIPGSILINDRGEIDDPSWQKNKRVNSITSNNSFNPGGKYISDGNDGSGGYLAPTHIQRRNVTSPGLTSHPEDPYGYNRPSSSSDATTFSRQKNFPQQTDNDINPWMNPYWPKSNQGKSQFKQNENKTQQSSNNSNQNSFINPYWDTKPSKKSTSSTEHGKNPYWKDNDTAKIGSASKNGIVLNDEDTWAFDHSPSSDNKAAPIPSFYERIYPPSPPKPSSEPKQNTKKDTKLPSETPKQNENDDEDLPYTIDNQGVAHYRASSSSESAISKTVNFAPSSITSQYPMVPPYTANSALPPLTANPTLPPQTANTTLPPQTANAAPLPPTTDKTSPSFPSSILPFLPKNLNAHPSSSATVLTQMDLESIQDALHLLETNPKAIRVIEASEQIPPSNDNQPNNFSSIFTSLFTGNREQQQPPPSLFSQNAQTNSSPYASNSNSQKTPLFSTPSYPSNSNESLRPLTHRGPVVLI